MKLFMVVMLAFWLAGCEPRSINSTYLTMKADIPWLQSFCLENPQPPVISYKGASAYVRIYCDKAVDEPTWLKLTGQDIKNRGWIDMGRDLRVFCNPRTGVSLLLTPRGANSHGDRGISMRFPDGGCSKFRPDPYQPLSAAKTSSQTINGE